ncbi:hypothetical protein DFQ30_004882 [Apophysomyces sp. BC1015]|nr:hypothetical protein DFQ30_004882 [Apophysomyces sp. BC1015]
MLRFQQRLRWFTRLLRRLETSSGREATASGLRLSPSERTTVISGSSQERASGREATRAPGPRRRPREEEALETTRSDEPANEKKTRIVPSSFKAIWKTGSQEAKKDPRVKWIRLLRPVFGECH